MQNDLNPRKRVEATRPIYRGLQTTSIKGAPPLRLFPPFPLLLFSSFRKPPRRLGRIRTILNAGPPSARPLRGASTVKVLAGRLCHVGGGRSLAW